MKFAAVFCYANHDRIAEIRPLHRAYLTSLKEHGKLWASGPFADDSGALIIYEVETEDEARAIIVQDPFNKAGVFASYEINEWRQVF